MANAVAAWLTAACLSICRRVCKHAKMFSSIVPIPMNLSPPPLEKHLPPPSCLWTLAWLLVVGQPPWSLSAGHFQKPSQSRLTPDFRPLKIQHPKSEIQNPGPPPHKSPPSFQFSAPPYRAVLSIFGSHPEAPVRIFAFTRGKSLNHTTTMRICRSKFMAKDIGKS